MNAQKRCASADPQFRRLPDNRASGQFPDPAQIWLLNVSQSESLPLLKPRANQVCRCREVP